MAIPVTLDDAKRQLRIEIDDTSQDVEIQGFIADAAAWVERYTGHILVARDVIETFNGFGPVKLRAWPIAATAIPAVAYVDLAGTPIAAAGARLSVVSRPARVLPPAGAHFWSFPLRDQLFSVTIRAGYEEGDPVPGNFRRAMLVLISGYYRDRAGGDVFVQSEASARSLCSSFRTRPL